MRLMPNANILPYNGQRPHLGHDVLVASGAQLIGDLVIGSESSVWFNTVIRADVQPIRIGCRTNIQDNSTIHVTAENGPCTIGNDVTVGHGAIIHACTIEDLCLIGMGAIILDKAVIRHGCVVGAGAVVTQGKEFPPRSMIIGSPGRAVRQLSDSEYAGLMQSAKHYIHVSRQYFGLAHLS
jgi:carbonic anhydrase/acetyltransferase-like protein (isoleucine patch superfamily)